MAIHHGRWHPPLRLLQGDRRLPKGDELLSAEPGLEPKPQSGGRTPGERWYPWEAQHQQATGPSWENRFYLEALGALQGRGRQSAGWAGLVLEAVEQLAGLLLQEL